jgi:predicted Fe-Mo cluster-binding NifX family protein
MKIAIPLDTDRGMDSNVYGHFGSAPFFAIYDADKESVIVERNPNQHHEHGQCTPSAAMTDLGVSAVVCGGMGARAITKLNDAGIKVYYADNLTKVTDAVKACRDGELVELSIDEACAGHDHGHHH